MATPTTNEILNMPFEQGLENFMSRVPVLADNAQELREKYAADKVVGAVRAAEIIIVEKVKRILAEGLAAGRTANEIQALLEQAGKEFSASYAETVQRTNMNTAYSEGRIEQAKKPVFRDIVGGFEFRAVGDAVTRPQHDFLDRMRSSQDDDALWDVFKSPLDYNCRCALVAISRAEIKPSSLDNQGRVRRWHPRLGFEFTISQLKSALVKIEPKELPNFVQER